MPAPAPGKPKLLDQARTKIRLKHYSIRTEQAYIDWMRRYVRFHGLRHPRDLGGREVEAFFSQWVIAESGGRRNPIGRYHTNKPLGSY